MKAANGRRAIFLLGAGASVEAGVCTGDQITSILVNYNSYCPSEHGAAIENLLRYIQVRIADYLGVAASEVNFEYILGALVELSRRDEYPIVPFLGEGDNLVKKLERRVPLREVVDKLYALLRELLFLRKPVGYLDPLKDFLTITKPLDLFTLNYDLSCETAFREARISLTTGFRLRNNERPIWDPKTFEGGSSVRLFKLHGSIDWATFFRYPPPKGQSWREAESYIEHYPVRLQCEPYPVYPVQPPDRSSGFVGVMNFGTRKELLYASPQFTILFNHFLTALSVAEVCVVVGYSFRDQRINDALVEAVVSRKGSLRLMVVDPSAQRIVADNPVLFELRRRGLLVPIGAVLSQTLKGGRLLKRVTSVLGDNTRSNRSVSPVATARTKRAATPEEVVSGALEAWRLVGTTLDLLYFWLRWLSNDLTRLEERYDASKETELGELLRPFLGKLRDLCYHIHWLYGAMGLQSPYEMSSLRDITALPKRRPSFSDVRLVRRWLPSLGRALASAFGKYTLTNAEFRQAAADRNYGKSIGAPTNLHMAELIARETVGRVDELVSIVNDLYKGAGYQEPFGAVIRQRENISRGAEQTKP